MSIEIKRLKDNTHISKLIFNRYFAIALRTSPSNHIILHQLFDCIVDRAHEATIIDWNRDLRAIFTIKYGAISEKINKICYDLAY